MKTTTPDPAADTAGDGQTPAVGPATGPPLAPLAPVLVNRATAAAMLAVSERMVWRLTAEGVLPAVRIGRCVRYRPSDIACWAERAAAEGGEA